MRPRPRPRPQPMTCRGNEPNAVSVREQSGSLQITTDPPRPGAAGGHARARAGLVSTTLVTVSYDEIPYKRAERRHTRDAFIDREGFRNVPLTYPRQASGVVRAEGKPC